MAEEDRALLALVAALIVALATAVFAYVRYVREQEHQRRTLLNALFAELANVVEHYTYAALELRVDARDGFEIRKRLKWSKYGPLRAANDIGKLGFLNASSVEALLQLELRIRNDGLLLDQLLEERTVPPREQLAEASARLRARAGDAAALLDELVASRPELLPALAAMKGRLPGLE